MSFDSVSLPRFNATYIYTRICKITRAKFQTSGKRKKKSKQEGKTSLFPNVTQIWQQQRILKEKRLRVLFRCVDQKRVCFFSRAHGHARAPLSFCIKLCWKNGCYSSIKLSWLLSQTKIYSKHRLHNKLIYFLKHFFVSSCPCNLLFQMKLAIIVVAMILLSCFEPTIQVQKRRGRVLRMCEKRFSTCLSNSRFRRDYKAGPKCCGRAWTVRLTNEFNRLNPCQISFISKKNISEKPKQTKQEIKLISSLA